MDHEERHDQDAGSSCAIGLTWYVPRGGRRRFHEDLERVLLRDLLALQREHRVTAVLPFHHRPLQGRRGGDADPWTDYWLVVLGRHADPDAVWQLLQPSTRAAAGSRSRFLRAELLRPQPGLDMYEPRAGGARREPRWHWIEYVVSRPAFRADYHQDQYRFSAPFIRRFYETGAVRRCIGFERERPLASPGSLPEWDVIHVTGFTAASLVLVVWGLLRFRRALDGLARGIGHTSSLAVLRSWEAKREKYQRLALQGRSSRLRPVQHTESAPGSTGATPAVSTAASPAVDERGSFRAPGADLLHELVK